MREDNDCDTCGGSGGGPGLSLRCRACNGTGIRDSEDDDAAEREAEARAEDRAERRGCR